MRKRTILTLIIGAIAPTALRADAPAESARPAAVLDMGSLRVAVVDDMVMQGWLDVSFTIALPDGISPGSLERRRPELRDAQLIALADFARLRVDPARAVDVGRVSAALEHGLAEAGVRGARVLIREVRAGGG